MNLTFRRRGFATTAVVSLAACALSVGALAPTAFASDLAPATTSTTSETPAVATTPTVSTESATPAATAPAPSATDSVPAPAPASVGTNHLAAGEYLLLGESLYSPNGRSTFVLQTDGNAVVYTDGRATWSTGTSGSGSSLTMQEDGNLVLYPSFGRAVWNARTANNPGAYAVIQDDGNLVIYREGNVALWSSKGGPKAIAPLVTDTLRAGIQLPAGNALTSPDGSVRAVFQPDGNFVVYGPTGVRWNTGSAGAGSRLVLQADGNAVLYNGRGGAHWNSGTSGNAGARLVIQNDANLVLYRADGSPAWDAFGATRPPAPVVTDTLGSGQTLYNNQRITSSDGSHQFVVQGDGNAVVYGPGGVVRFNTGSAGGGAQFAMQGDGNAVLYSSSGRVVWQTGTAGQNGARLVVQNDGNLVVYRGNSAIWSSFAALAPSAPPPGGPAQPGAPAGPGPSRNVNCSSFSSQGQAQAWFEFYRYRNGLPRDIAGLDADNDGTACESYRY